MAGFGAFGKMPTLGDFFRFDLPQDFVVAWDRWLQRGLVQVRADLGARWAECYTSAPIWRFTLTAGLAGSFGAQGIVMPSIDRVGRQFPLTLAAPIPAGRSAVLGHLGATRTFEALETIALDALGDVMTLPRLTERVRGVRLPVLPGLPECAVSPGLLAISVSDGTDVSHTIAAHEAGHRFKAPSIWSAALSGADRVMLAEGLPGPRRMRGLFDLGADVWRDIPASERILS
ncbi:type VI secretion system-associated protein TagF [Meridianimarinicoccus aquatilis]|nr:type VI secretion system-associated protein TagF [Fluviibacterium aquatile]